MCDHKSTPRYHFNKDTQFTDQASSLLASFSEYPKTIIEVSTAGPVNQSGIINEHHTDTDQITDYLFKSSVGGQAKC